MNTVRSVPEVYRTMQSIEGEILAQGGEIKAGEFRREMLGLLQSTERVDAPDGSILVYTQEAVQAIWERAQQIFANLDVDVELETA